MNDVTRNPSYVPGHGLLKGRSVLITAAAGAGIGFVGGIFVVAIAFVLRHFG